MAVKAYTKAKLSGLGEVETITWTLAKDDTGQPYALPNGYSTDLHVGGTFGTGGSVTLYGSSLASDQAVAVASGSWATLADVNGNALTKTAAACEAVVEQPLYVGPQCSDGDGTTSIIVTLVLRRKY